MYIYPDNLTAKATLWLWALRDVGVLAVSGLLSAFAMLRLGWTAPAICTVVYGFLAIQVGGYIEIVPLGDACLVCNDEGKLNGMEGNRRLSGDIIAGPFFIAGDSGVGDLCSLTMEQQERFSQRFAQPETFRPGEVEDTIRIEIYTM